MNAVIREVATLDPDAAWEEITKVDQEVRFLAVLLLTASLPWRC